MKRFLTGLLSLATLAVAARADEKPEPKAEAPAVVKGDNAFALDLYAHLRGQDGNLFFSPYSISTALAMTRAGALGDTAAEMDKALHFTLPQDQLHAAYAALVKQVNGDPADKKRGYQLSTANALWGQMGYDFKPEFLKQAKDDYGAGLNNVDFMKAPEEARRTINAWVEKQTQDKIKDLIAPDVLTPLTRLVLTNAIYFKGDWAGQFKKDQTKDGPFLLAEDKKIDAPMMRQKGQFGYLESDKFQALEMPYAGNDLSMVVLLPKKVDGLADLEKDLTADKLAGWVGKLSKQEVLVSLPKFKTTQTLGMKKVLSDMGMPLAFSDRADFSGIGSVPGDLHLADVIHKAYVDVNEEGTEAAAATAVVVTARGAPTATPEFRADHPFVFLIRDTRNDGILFLGRLADPTK